MMRLVCWLKKTPRPGLSCQCPKSTNPGTDRIRLSFRRPRSKHLRSARLDSMRFYFHFFELLSFKPFRGLSIFPSHASATSSVSSEAPFISDFSCHEGTRIQASRLGRRHIFAVPRISDRASKGGRADIFSADSIRGRFCFFCSSKVMHEHDFFMCEFALSVLRGNLHHHPVVSS